MDKELTLPGNLPKVPETLRVTTGPLTEEFAIMEKFFSEVCEFLGYNERSRNIFCEQVSRMLDASTENSSPRPTDDFVILQIAGDCMVASAIFRRTVFNNVEISFSHYLTDEVIRQATFKQRTT